MRSSAPAVRAAIGLAMLAALACATVGQLRLHDYNAERDRATASASGRVVETGIGEYDDIRVRWTDGEGRSRVSRFSVYDDYSKGGTFKVAYDREHPGARVFPADADETSDLDDMWVSAYGPLLIPAVILLWWAVRLLRVRAARRRPSSYVRVEVFSSPNDKVEFLAEPLRRMWVRSGGAAAEQVQRVMWHPALEDLPRTPSARVSHGGRSALVTFDDGTTLMPVGRLREALPDDAVPYADLRESTADLVVGASGEFADPWTRAFGIIAAVGASAGAVPGFAEGNRTLLWMGAVLGAAVAVNLWALHGARR
jgi:hypothetical protein